MSKTICPGKSYKLIDVIIYDSYCACGKKLTYDPMLINGSWISKCKCGNKYVIETEIVTVRDAEDDDE